MPSLAPVALAVLALTACSAQAPTTSAGTTPTSPQANTSPSGDPKAPTATAAATPPPAGDPAWVDAGGGLSVRLDVPPGPHKLGATVELGLEFRNEGQDDIRVYLIQTPIFRALQSDLAVYAGGKFLGSQPDPHPHGYVVTERDFPAIPPGTTQRFTQPLHLDPAQLGAATEVEVKWTYQNKVESWAGGVQTLDGPTKSLFGGARIPGIWLGEVKATALLPLTR